MALPYSTSPASGNSHSSGGFSKNGRSASPSSQQQQQPPPSPGKSGNASNQTGPALRPKKSFDWLPKSFKRKSSSSSSVSSLGSASSSSRALGGGSGSTRSAGGSATSTMSNGNEQVLLTIPGSPNPGSRTGLHSASAHQNSSSGGGDSYSSPSSSTHTIDDFDDRYSARSHPSPPVSGQQTPDEPSNLTPNGVVFTAGHHGAQNPSQSHHHKQHSTLSPSASTHHQLLHPLHRQSMQVLSPRSTPLSGSTKFDTSPTGSSPPISSNISHQSANATISRHGGLMMDMRDLRLDSSKTPTAESTTRTLKAPTSDTENRNDQKATTVNPASEYEKLLLSLSSRKVLRTMLDDPVGLWKFGQFLASEMNAETLVFWLNAEQHRNDLKRLRSLTQRIHSLHIPSTSPLALNITSNERQSIERSIRSFNKVDDPFSGARDAAFQALYLDAWPRFLKWRLELMHEKLRSGGLTAPQTSFTLADPSRDRDQPLLLVSDGFLDLTGYNRTDVMMRNCRFLQGPGTSSAAIDRIRNACVEGLHITELLLNYRKDGVPFWSLLRIIPLRNANGKLKYLLGAQINVTSVLAATADLAHLLADEIDPSDMPPRPPFEHDLAEDQKQNTGHAMRSYLDSIDKRAAEKLTTKSELERKDIADRAQQLRSHDPSGTQTLSPTWSPSVHGTMSSTPQLDSAGIATSTSQRPRSANRDLHLQAAAALAFEGTSGSLSTSARPVSPWMSPPSHRPTTSGSLFQRPGTAYSVHDIEGKEQAQLSLAEQTKAFNEASSHYMVLDSTGTTVLFHSANLPAAIVIGTNFCKLIGSKLAHQLQEQIKLGQRIDVDSVSFDIPAPSDPRGIWRKGVRACLTPLKDQINEVGAVVVLLSHSSQ